MLRKESQKFEKRVTAKTPKIFKIKYPPSEEMNSKGGLFSIFVTLAFSHPQSAADAGRVSNREQNKSQH